MRDAAYHCYRAILEPETNIFVSHQSQLLVNNMLEMLEEVDEMRGVLEKMACRCHRTLRCHASMVEVLGRNPDCREYNIVLREEVEENRAVEEGNDSDGEEVGIKEEMDGEERRDDGNHHKEVKEEAEEAEQVECKEEEIKEGDMILCIGGKEKGCYNYCKVIKISESKKSFILEDKRGRCFCKYRRTIAKHWPY